MRPSRASTPIPGPCTSTFGPREKSRRCSPCSTGSRDGSPTASPWWWIPRVVGASTSERSAAERHTRVMLPRPHRFAERSASPSLRPKRPETGISVRRPQAASLRSDGTVPGARQGSPARGVGLTLGCPAPAEGTTPRPMQLPTSSRRHHRFPTREVATLRDTGSIRELLLTGGDPPPVQLPPGRIRGE